MPFIVLICVPIEITLFHAEKMSNIEMKLRSNEDELRRKEKIILELGAQLEAAKSSDKGKLQIEEISIHLREQYFTDSKNI